MQLVPTRDQQIWEFRLLVHFAPPLLRETQKKCNRETPRTIILDVWKFKKNRGDVPES